MGGIPVIDGLEVLDVLVPVGLDELDATAALLTRRDRKYLVPFPVAETLVAGGGRRRPRAAPRGGRGGGGPPKKKK